MRRIARVDANQAEIVTLLRAAGATVQTLHTVGGGCPDLLIGWRGCNLLAEVKDSSKPPSDRTLTPAEAAWHESWRGQVAIVDSIASALRLLGVEA